MEILRRETDIPEYGDGVIFVRYGKQIAIGDYGRSHAQLALKHELHYPNSEGGRKPLVDDGGEIIDDGEKLIITDYFTTTTMPIAERNGLVEKRDFWNIRKEIRQETGALIAKITGRKVKVHHSDETVDIF